MIMNRRKFLELLLFSALMPLLRKSSGAAEKNARTLRRAMFWRRVETR